MGYEEGLLRGLTNNYVDDSQDKVNRKLTSTSQRISNIAKGNRKDLTTAYEVAKEVGASSLMGGDIEAILKQAEYDKAITEKAKAEKQSSMTQFGNMLVQTASELVLGTLAGIARIPDAAKYLYEEVKGEPSDWNFVNPVADAIDSANEWIKNEYAPIHRSSDDDLAFGEFGWWMEGLPSTISTLTLLVPAIGQAKALSYVSRLGKLGKWTKGLSRGTAKQLAKALNRLEDTSKLEGAALRSATNKNLRAIAKLDKDVRMMTENATMAFFSRTGENLQEASGAYTEIYNERKQQLDNMNEDEKAEFIKNNPDFKGKSNDEIAKIMAHDGANETFKKDYVFFITDFIEFAVANRLFRNAIKKQSAAPSRKIQEYNKTQLDKALGRTSSKKAANNGIINHLPSKANLKDALETIITEGVEEGGQTIFQHMGNDSVNKYFNKDYATKPFGSYLSDSDVWDSAFWGAIGGVLFNAGARAATKGFRDAKLMIDLKKGKISSAEFKLLSAGNDFIQHSEIKGRMAKFADLQHKLDLLSRGFNPESRIDAVDNSTGEQLYETVDDREREELASKYISNFVTDVTLDAADAGTFELLQDWLTDKQFQEFIASKINDYNVGEALDFGREVTEKMNSIYDAYTLNKLRIADNVSKEALKKQGKEYEYNEHTLNKLARLYTRIELQRDIASDLVDEDYNKLIGLGLSDVNVQSYSTSRILKRLAKIYQDVNKRIEALEKKPTVEKSDRNYYEKYANKQVVDEEIKQLEKKLEYIRSLTKELGFEESLYNNEEALHDLFSGLDLTTNEEVADETANRLLEQYSKHKVDEMMYASYMAHSSQDMIDDYKEMAVNTDNYTRARLKEYTDKITEYFRGAKTIEELETRMDKVMNFDYEDLDVDLQEAIKGVNYGFSNTIEFARYVDGQFKARGFEIAAAARQEEDERNHTTQNAERTRVEPEPQPQPQPQSAAEPENVVQVETVEGEARQVETENIDLASLNIPSESIEIHNNLFDNDAEYKQLLLDLKKAYNNDEPVQDILVKLRNKFIDAVKAKYGEHELLAKRMFEQVANRIEEAFGLDTLGQILSSMNAIGRTADQEEIDKFIDKALTEYSQKRGRYTKSKLAIAGNVEDVYVVDFVDLFSYLINQSDLNNDQIIRLFQIIVDRVNRTNDTELGKKFVLVNLKSSILRNPVSFINKIRSFKELNEDDYMRISDVTPSHILLKSIQDILHNNGYYTEFATNSLNEDARNKAVSDYYEIKNLLYNEYIYNKNRNISLKVEYIKETNSLVYYFEVKGGIHKNDDGTHYIRPKDGTNGINGETVKFEIGYQAIPEDAKTGKNNERLEYLKNSTKLNGVIVDGYVLSIGNSISGFNYEISLNADGDYFSNADYLFNNIINPTTEEYKKLRDLLDRIVVNRLVYINNHELSNDYQLNNIWTSDNILALKDFLYAEAKKCGYTFAQTNGKNTYTDSENIQKMLNDIISILYKDDTGVKNESDVSSYIVGADSDTMTASYNTWKGKLFKNYEQTTSIKNLLDKGKTPKLSWSSIYTVYAPMSDELRDVKKNFEELGFTINTDTTTPIGKLAYMDGNTLMVEGYTSKYTDYYRAPDSSGMRVGIVVALDHKGIPIVHWYDNMKNISTDKQLRDSVALELQAIFNSFENGGTVDEIQTALDNLFGYRGLFYGYNIVRDAEANGTRIRIFDHSNTNTPPIVTLHFNNGSEGDGERVLTLRYGTKEGENIKYGYANSNSNYITNVEDSNDTYEPDYSIPVEEVAANIIIDGSYNGVNYAGGVKFNFSKQAMDNSEGNNNKYFSVENDNGYVVFTTRLVNAETGEVEEKVYDGFLDFAIQHNIGQTRNEVITVNNTKTGVACSVMHRNTWLSYDEGTENVRRTTSYQDAPIIIFRKNTTTRNITPTSRVNSFKGFFRNMGLDDRDFNILLGEDFDLLPKEFTLEFNSASNAVSGNWDHNTGLIKIRVPIMSIDKHSDVGRGMMRDIIRVAMHENLHRLFSADNIGLNTILKEETNRNVILADEILDVMNEALAAFNDTSISLPDGIRNPSLAALFTNYSKNGKFSIEKYASINKISLETEADKQYVKVLLAHELIVESLTDANFVNLLNSVKAIDPVTGKTTDESLLSKIIKAILKFFGVNVNKESLLEKEIILLTGKLEEAESESSEEEYVPTSITAAQKSSEDNIDKISSAINFNEDDHSYTVNGIPAAKSVTQLLYPTRERTETLDTILGNETDEFLRQFIDNNFSDEGLNLTDEQRSKFSFIINNPEILINQITDVVGENWKAISKKESLFVAANSNQGLIAGGTDLLVLDSNGRLHIFDFKVVKNPSELKNNEGYNRQQNAYAEMYEVNGFEVASINLIGINKSADLSSVNISNSAIITLDRKKTPFEFSKLDIKTPHIVDTEDNTAIINDTIDENADHTELDIDPDIFDDSDMNAIARNAVDSNAIYEIPDTLYSTDLTEIEDVARDSNHNVYELQLMNGHLNYIESFPIEMQQNIANMIDTGMINIVCR